MTTTQHLISTGNLACELGISVNVLNRALDKLGYQPIFTLNKVPYYPERAIGKITKHLDGIGNRKKASSKRNADAL